MAYRDDLAALEARQAAVEAEVLEKTRARDEVARLVDETRYLARAEAAFGGKACDSTRRGDRRRGWRWLALAAGVVAGVGGLAAHDTSRPVGPILLEVVFLQMAAYEGAMCGCTELEHPSSTECVQRVSDEMMRWGTKFVKEPPTLDEEETRRATTIGERIGACMVRAMTPPVVAMPPPPEPEPRPCDEVSCILDNYQGACCAALEKSSTKATRSDLPDGIDRSMISAAIANVKSRVTACGDTSTARGKVKVHVKVDGSGRVSGVSVEVAPDPELGACVAAAVRKASFARTQHGGSFSYPFVF